MGRCQGALPPFPGTDCPTPRWETIEKTQHFFVKNMASIAIMVGGGVLNAATFIGDNYLARALGGDNSQAALDEKKASRQSS